MRVLGRTAGVVVLLAVMLLAWSASGCFVRTRDRTVTGPHPVPDGATLSSLKVGETTRQWVIETLGQPTRTKDLEGGGQLLIYEYLERESGHTRVLVIATYRWNETSVMRLSFEVRDGIVTRFERERIP
ncbi:MAG: hypothetical protein ACYS8K_02305 [Planctomycetota bacterium]